MGAVNPPLDPGFGQGSTRVLITGATGFVGRATVRAARARGLSVVAAARRQTALWTEDSGVQMVAADLSQPGSTRTLRDAMSGVGSVIHAAAHLGGDAAVVASDTVGATQTVLDALQDHPAHLVLVSSIAVYDTMQIPPGARLDEQSPLERAGSARDAYTDGKLQQEHLLRQRDRHAWILRPGAVYGPDRTWHALMGFWASKMHVQIGSAGVLPMVHVDHLARSLVDAAMTPPQGQIALNVIDDDLPTRARYLAAHRRLAGWPKAHVSVPFAAWLPLTRLVRPISARLPGLFREPVLRARMMPLAYPNTALRRHLGGHDMARFEDMLDRAIRESSR